MGKELATPKQRVSIGTKNSDAELIDRILAYKKENKYANAADAVRALCEFALDYKKLTR